MKQPRIPHPTMPGEMLTEEFLVPHGMSQTALAERIGCAPRSINEICNGKPHGHQPTDGHAACRGFRQHSRVLDEPPDGLGSLEGMGETFSQENRIKRSS